MDNVFNAGGIVTWICSVSMGLMEWLGNIEVNKWLTGFSLCLGIVYFMYRIRVQRLELNLKKREYDEKMGEGIGQSGKDKT